MDFFSKLRKSKPTKPLSFKDELQDFESKDTNVSLYLKAKELKRLIEKGKIQNAQQVENYLLQEQNFPLSSKINDVDNIYGINKDKMLTNLFFYFWLGGNKCITQDNNECLRNINNFNKVYSKFKNYFYPLLAISEQNRDRILRLKAQSVGQMNEIVITLDDKVPGGFIVVDKSGRINHWDPTQFSKFQEKILFGQNKPNKKPTYVEEDYNMVDDLFNFIETGFSSERLPTKLQKPEPKISISKPVRRIKFDSTKTPKLYIIDFDKTITKLNLCEKGLGKIPELIDTYTDLYIKGELTKQDKLSKSKEEIYKDAKNKLKPQIDFILNGEDNISKFREYIKNLKNEGNDIVVFGDANKKDILIILDYIFGDYFNPFDKNSIITLQDFNQKACSSRQNITDKMIIEKANQKFGYDEKNIVLL